MFMQVGNAVQLLLPVQCCIMKLKSEVDSDCTMQDSLETQVPSVTVCQTFLHARMCHIVWLNVF